MFYAIYSAAAAAAARATANIVLEKIYNTQTMRDLNMIESAGTLGEIKSHLLWQLETREDNAVIAEMNEKVKLATNSIVTGSNKENKVLIFGTF